MTVSTRYQVIDPHGVVTCFDSPSPHQARRVADLLTTLGTGFYGVRTVYLRSAA